MRRDRAARAGIEQFLFDRAFDDCLERLSDIRGDFEHALFAGCPNPDWPSRLALPRVEVIDPGPIMAERVGGHCAHLENLPFEAAQFDLCLTIGLLDIANNLPLAAAALNLVLRPGGLLLGAIVGGESLPKLRSAMLAADSVSGRATPHVHPRIDAASLAQLLSSTGFTQPVVDVDRLDIRYASLDALVRDLRAMGATNILSNRSRRPVSRTAYQTAQEAFMSGQPRVTEQLEILHFAAWKPA